MCSTVDSSHALAAARAAPLTASSAATAGRGQRALNKPGNGPLAAGTEWADGNVADERCAWSEPRRSSEVPGAPGAPGAGGHEPWRERGGEGDGEDGGGWGSMGGSQCHIRPQGAPTVGPNPAFAGQDLEAESFSSVTEQRVKRRPIWAQCTAIARAMARICKDERASFGVMSGHDRKTLSLSASQAAFRPDPAVDAANPAFWPDAKAPPPQLPATVPAPPVRQRTAPWGPRAPDSLGPPLHSARVK